MTGPAMPKPAARIFSSPRWVAAIRENSLAMRSKVAKSLLRKRCLKTDVSLPPFSENNARLHLVPPTSPASITRSPKKSLNANRCAATRKETQETCHFLPSRSSKLSASLGPQLPEAYCGTLAVLAALQASRTGSTRDQAASTLSPRSKRVASPRRQSLTRVAYALREESPNPSR